MNIEGDIEQMAEESERDRVDHADLVERVDGDFPGKPAIRAVGVAAKVLLDIDRIEPIVIAKTMLVGDRDGAVMYMLSSKASSMSAVALCEARTLEVISTALATHSVEHCAFALAVGATWVATQYGVDRPMLVRMAREASRRERDVMSGLGAVDFADRAGWDRGLMLRTIELAKIPLYAPLEFAR